MRFPRFLTVAVLIAVVPGLPAASGTESAPPHESVVRGEVLYRVHCAACHGVGGRGDGPVAGELRTAPTDLTRLTVAGVFPTDRVRGSIDGRQEIRSHGSSEMPIWGLTFVERGRVDDQEAAVAGRIDDLTAYVRSIQGGD